MSTPPDPPEVAAYRIDPDRQCGVVKADGNRCTARLSCKIHTEKDKTAVGDRTKSYAKLLKVQPESIALDPRPTSHDGDDTATTRFAPVFDPDMHCGADLNTGYGEPCALDILACKTHSYLEQSNVQGRSGGLDDLLRVHRANASRVPDYTSTTTANLETECGVARPDKKSCRAALPCRRHTLAAKRAISRSSPFGFDVLLRLQLTRKFYLEMERAAGLIDPEIHCGVAVGSRSRSHTIGDRCLHALNCTVHSDVQKRDVRRNTAFDALLVLQSQTLADSDSLCQVALPGGGMCMEELECSRHNFVQRDSVPRRTDLSTLIPIHRESLTVHEKMAFGFPLIVLEAEQHETPSASVIQRYRRSSTQTLSASIQEVQGGCFDYSVADEGSDNRNRLRGFLFAPVPETPDQSVDHILSRKKCRTLSAENARLYDEGTEFIFAFAEKPSQLKATWVDTSHAVHGRSSRTCSVVASKSDLNLLAVNAQTVLDRLRSLFERSPVELNLTPARLKDWLLYNAVLAAALDTKDTNEHSRIPFQFKLAVLGDKPCVVLDIRILGSDTGEGAASMQVPIAIPIHNDMNETPVPKLTNLQLFDFEGLEVGEPWLGLPLQPEKKQRIIEVASYIVATTHLVPMEREVLNFLVASELSPMFNIVLLLQINKRPNFSDTIAVYDPATGRVSAPPFLGFPDIQTYTHSLSGDLIVQCAKVRFLQSKDFLAAWSDASNAADMHAEHPEDLVRIDCDCSPEDSEAVTHMCLICRRLATCCSLVNVELSLREVRACPACVDDIGSVSMVQAFAKTPKAPKASASAVELRKTTEGMRKLLRLRYTASVLHDNANASHKINVSEFSDADKTLLRQMTDRVHATPGGPEVWQCDDGYFVTPITSAYNDDGNLMMCSIEACRPVIWQDGIARIHALSNTIVTRRYANGLCGYFPSICLRIFHDLDASTSEDEQDELIERLDNLYLIGSQVPYYIKGRLALPFDPTFADQLSAQHGTGVAILEACDRIAARDLWNYTIKGQSMPHQPNFTSESLPEIDEVQQFVADLESTADKKFRRVNDVPYPFQGGPDVANWSWHRFYMFVNARLERLRRFCNKRHRTVMSVQQLLCAILFLLYHGRQAQPSQLLDLPVSIGDKNPLGISIGKGKHDAGMTSGFDANQPISFEGFDFEKLNLCVEPKLCNDAKSNRDDQVDLIRKDFRDNLKIDNPGVWPAQLPPLDRRVRDRYITRGLFAAGELEDGDLEGERGDGGNVSAGDDGPDILDEDDEDEQDSGPAGEDNTPGALTTVPPKRNMSNLGATCYLSTVLQTLHNNEAVRQFVMRDDNFAYKAHTGVPDDEYLRHLPIDLRILNAQEIRDAREARLEATIQPVVSGLRKLFHALDLGGDRLSPANTQDFLASLQLIDHRWENKSNESAQLLDTILFSLITASDRSDPSARGTYGDTARSRNTLALAPIAEDANHVWDVYCAEGHDTRLVDMFHSQYVSEIACSLRKCHSVRRSFEHTFVKYLNMINPQPGQIYTLEELLIHFNMEYLTHGSRCKANGDHTPSFMRHRRISRAAEYMCFAIHRGEAGVMEVMNTVVLPDQVDLGPIMDMQRIPSNTLEGQLPKETVPVKKVLYDLVAVNNWVDFHYVGYVRNPNDGSWIMFNDLQTHPVAKSPMEGWRHGEIVHYGVYQRHVPHVSADAGENVAENQGGEGGDNDDGMDVQQDETNAQPPKTPGKNARSMTLEVSASKQTTSKSPRGSLHEDISDARHEDTLNAREAELVADLAKLRQDQAQLSRDQAKLHREDAQRHDENERTKKQLHLTEAKRDRRNKTQQAENERITAETQAAKIESDRQIEAAKLESDRQIRADRAESDRQIQSAKAESDRQTQAAKIENERVKAEFQTARIEHNRRVSAVEEAEKLLDERNKQRTALLQSIRELRADLRTREASHQSELASLEDQMRGLQQAMEVVRVEMTNVTARYRQGKAEAEDKIDKLQDEIDALFK
jgi:ubiquitin C-terminal hydrolase